MKSRGNREFPQGPLRAIFFPLVCFHECYVHYSSNHEVSHDQKKVFRGLWMVKDFGFNSKTKKKFHVWVGTSQKTNWYGCCFFRFYGLWARSVHVKILKFCLIKCEVCCQDGNVCLKCLTRFLWLVTRNDDCKLNKNSGQCKSKNFSWVIHGLIRYYLIQNYFA